MTAHRHDFAAAAADAIGRCRLCTTNDFEVLVEEIAATMWESRSTVEDPRTWETAGDLWWEAYRQLADVAYLPMRRIDDDQA